MSPQTGIRRKQKVQFKDEQKLETILKDASIVQNMSSDAFEAEMRNSLSLEKE